MPATAAFAWVLRMFVVVLLVAACVSDTRTRRIPNEISVAGAACALGWNAFAPAGGGLFSSSHPGGLGLPESAFGAMAAFGVFLALHLMRFMGAGDVKFMGFLGALFGLHSVAELVIAVFAAGGVLALVRIAIRRRGRRVLSNLWLLAHGAAARLAGASGPRFDPSVDTADRLPYAYALSLGALALAIRQHLA